MYQLGMIFGVLVLAPKMGISGLAWGVVLGAGLHLGLQLPALARLGGHYEFILGLRIAEVREVIRLMIPTFAGRGCGATEFLDQYPPGHPNGRGQCNWYRYCFLFDVNAASCDCTIYRHCSNADVFGSGSIGEAARNANLPGGWLPAR